MRVITTWQKNGKPVVGNVSGANFWQIQDPSKGLYFEHRGGEGATKEWINLIGLTPIFIIETTWNDYTESYTTPVADPTKASTGYGISALLKPHVGYSELRKRYVQWYKTGVRPTVVKDELITHAQNLVAHDLLSEHNTGQSLCKDSAHLAGDIGVVRSGGILSTYSVAAGAVDTEIPFHPGVQSFELARGGIVFLSAIGADQIQSSITKYNYEYTTGFAYAP